VPAQREEKFMLKIGVVGCTGAVGGTFLELLAERAEYEVECFASARSAGTRLQAGSKTYLIREFSVDACRDCDLVFLCVSGDFSKEYGPALAENSFVVDNSSAFRYVEEIPLLVPPVNGDSYGNERLIANPNCSSAIALMALGPLHREYHIESLIVSTYQAASRRWKNSRRTFAPSRTTGRMPAATTSSMASRSTSCRRSIASKPTATPAKR
jgi:aspartate-semialdehyde dehydrogenase